MGCIYLLKWVILFPLGKHPEVKWLDHMVVLFLIFWESSILLSIVSASVYILTKRAQGVPFSLHPHQHLSLLVILMMTILKGMTQYIIALWICISLIISDVEHSFTKLLVFHVSALEKNVFWDLLPIFKSNYLFFYYWVVWVPHIFWILTPKSDIGWKYFSSHSVACFFTSLFASCFWEHFSLV